MKWLRYRAMPMHVCAWCIALAGTLSVRADAPAPAASAPWPDTFTARLEALALLETFNAELLTHDSATLTLERWCDMHRLASPARIVAERVSVGASDAAPEAHPLEKPLAADQRQELAIGSADTVRYRRVRLRCGPLVLSEADNWYVPARLTPEMNRQLDTSDVPFGKVVQPLHFRRRTLSSTLLWLPLPEGWEMMSAAGAGDGTQALLMPHALLEHRALLTLPDGTPISEVVETYTSAILAFPPPKP
jgi:hypothetical protein